MMATWGLMVGERGWWWWQVMEALMERRMVVGRVGRVVGLRVEGPPCNKGH